jgi:hypothetical protein
MAPFTCKKLDIYNTSIQFARGKACMTKESEKAGTSSNGNNNIECFGLTVTAINWFASGDVEVTSVFGGKKMGTTTKNFSQPSQR